MLDLFDLTMFARIVEAGSFSNAARELHVSPAVASKRLSRLEDRLGALLLQRTTRRLTLTEAGEDFYERIAAILHDLGEAEAIVAGTGAPRGVLRLSAPTAFTRLHIAPRLKDFIEAHPQVRLELDLTDEKVDLLEGKYDLAVRIGMLDDSSMVARRLAPNRRIFCATPDYLARFGEPARLDHLAGHHLLAASNQIEWHVEGPEGPRTLRPVSVLQANSSEVIREAVVSGMGIGLRSTWDVATELRSGALRHILKHYAGSSRAGIYVLYPSRRLVPPKVRVFVDYLAGLFGEEPYWEHGLDFTPGAPGK